MTPEQQRMSALKIASTVRSLKKELKAEIKEGSADPVSVIQTTTLPFTVAELIGAIRGFGEVKVCKICKATGIEPHKRFDSKRPTMALTDRQRTELAAIVDDILECRESPTRGYSPYEAVAA